jgi:high-affinity nickel-transport protein
MAAANVPTVRIGGIRASMTRGDWAQAAGMLSVIVSLHVLGFGLLVYTVASGTYHLSSAKVFGVGTGVLAYIFGLRHAFDADHISAIDNTTRKLLAEGKRPLSVGFFFSLGHSTIVFILAVLLNFGIKALYAQVSNASSALQKWTNVFGTGVSGLFLYLIAVLNLVILRGIIQIFRELRQGKYDDAELDRQLNSRGFMFRFFGPLARQIDEPWKMYPVGVLFGLGFDTSTEVALLVLSGSAVAGGLPFWAIMSLPLLFAAGMSMMDTADGAFMRFAYSWAFFKPIRKVYYNLAITGLSVLVALFIGSVELLGLMASDLHLKGAGWAWLAGFDINKAGFAIVGLFVLTWAVALSVWHFGHIEARWETAAAQARAARGEVGPEAPPAP